MLLRTNLVAAAAAAPGTIFVVIALNRFGFRLFALLAAAVLAVLIVDRVRVAVALPLVAVVLVENDPYAGLNLGGLLYAKVPGLPVTTLEALLLLALAAVVLTPPGGGASCGRRRSAPARPAAVALIGLA